MNPVNPIFGSYRYPTPIEEKPPVVMSVLPLPPPPGSMEDLQDVIARTLSILPSTIESSTCSTPEYEGLGRLFCAIAAMPPDVKAAIMPRLSSSLFPAFYPEPLWQEWAASEQEKARIIQGAICQAWNCIPPEVIPVETRDPSVHLRYMHCLWYLIDEIKKVPFAERQNTIELVSFLTNPGMDVKETGDLVYEIGKIRSAEKRREVVEKIRLLTLSSIR